MGQCVGHCFDCGAETTIVSEKPNVAGDMKTLTFGCGHTLSVGVVLSLSHLSTKELKTRLRYNQRMVKLKNICRTYRDSAAEFIPKLEAELKDRGV